MVGEIKYDRLFKLTDRFKFLNVFFSFTVLATLLIIYGRLIHFKESINNHYLLILMFVVSMVGLIFSTMIKNIQVAKIALFVFSSILFPLRVYTSGGSLSYAVIWICSLLIVVYFVLDKRSFICSSIIWMSLLLANLFFPLPITDAHFTEAAIQARGLTNILGFLVFFILTNYVRRPEFEILESFAKSERKKISKQIYAKSAHEILSPLSAVRGYAQLLQKKEKYNPGYIEGIIRSSDKISLLIKELEIAVDSDEVTVESFDYKETKIKTT